ncbi:hypothetical protein GGX14DRAFT_405060 [Mycena pura]|uniref:Uncharacterized protein n=1 Tax=Mycena pura TaxID=153505 RepID=A0AAD6UX18_9AGAR|nr:hypothetical protein GGX14DRAFT_405060 [Mycena pura]
MAQNFMVIDAGTGEKTTIRTAQPPFIQEDWKKVWYRLVPWVSLYNCLVEILKRFLTMIELPSGNIQGNSFKKSFKAFGEDTQKISTIWSAPEHKKYVDFAALLLELPSWRRAWLSNGTKFIQIGPVVPKIWTIRTA